MLILFLGVGTMCTKAVLLMFWRYMLHFFGIKVCPECSVIYRQVWSSLTDGSGIRLALNPSQWDWYTV